MKTLNSIWKFVNSKIFNYIVIVVTIIILVSMCSKNVNLNDEVERNEQNISALTDTITTVKTKNGDLQSSISGYIATGKKLKELNENLANQVSNQKGKVITLNNIIFQLKQDTSDLNEYIRNSENETEKINDSTYNLNWKLSYIYDSLNYDIYNGQTQLFLTGNYKLLKDLKIDHNTKLLNRDSQINLIWGQKWEKVDGENKLKIFAETAHPAFQTKLLEGVYVDYPKKRHWFTGFGIGPSLNLGYDLINSKLVLAPGISIHYNIYQW